MELLLEHQRVIASVKKLVISHPQFEAALKTIVTAYELRKNVQVVQNIICTGESGTGKSTLKECIRKLYERYDVKDKTIIPVLVVETPSAPTVKSLAEQMLIQLDDKNYTRGSAIDKTNRILNYIKKCGVMLIIFDELQHFIDQGKRRSPYEVSDWLKTIIDRAGTATILMGLERSEQILKVNEQLRRRFSKRIILSAFDIDNRSSRNNFKGLIKILDEKVGLPNRIDITEQSLIYSIYYATNGIIDYLVKLFIGAYECALHYEKSELCIICFEEAFTLNIWVDGIGKLNPFHKKFIDEKLDKPGMPFHKVDDIAVERLC